MDNVKGNSACAAALLTANSPSGWATLVNPVGEHINGTGIERPRIVVELSISDTSRRTRGLNP